MKRVLLLTPKLNGHDGVSLVSRQAVKAMSARGWRVEVASLSDEVSTDNNVERCRTVESARNSKFRFASILLKRALDLGPPEERPLVFVMHLHLGPAALPLIWRDTRLAVFLHGTEVWKPLRRWERTALRAASTVMANSSYTVDRFKQANPEFRYLRVNVCPLGIDPIAAYEIPDHAKPDDRPTISGRSRILPPFALMVSRMVAEDRYKGHDRLLEIWQKRTKDDPTLKLVIVGDGSDRTRLERKSRNSGLEGRVIFTGLISDGELSGLYRDCEFFVLPSTGEGFGLVYLEAMRARKACIAAPGAAAEIIEHGVTGLLVNPDLPQEVYDAVRSLASSPQVCREMGLAGYRRLLERFTSDCFANSLLAALDTSECAKP
ncbi:MAG: glycosyltransferase family 4 protein [Terriglobales bacterium]|jgi:glycosyltransferase involved in cell wall biosynthesis